MVVRLSNGKEIPIEMHKVQIVQKTNLIPVDRRLNAIEEGGYNTFSLRTRDVFVDSLTDSGTNAMTDSQLAAMMVSDDAYAGSESFYKLASAVKDVLGFKYLLPVHQGRAAEYPLAKVYVKPGDIVPMNYHFTTSKAHFELAGGKAVEGINTVIEPTLLDEVVMKDSLIKKEVLEGLVIVTLDDIGIEYEVIERDDGLPPSEVERRIKESLRVKNPQSVRIVHSGEELPSSNRSELKMPPKWVLYGEVCWKNGGVSLAVKNGLTKTVLERTLSRLQELLREKGYGFG